MAGWPLQLGPGTGTAPTPGPQAQQAIQDSERASYLQQLSQPQPATPLQTEAGEWGMPPPGSQPPQPEEEPLYGELPGEGYLFAHDPETRQATLIETTPEFARMALLRMVEVGAINATLPYSEQKPSEWGHAVLMAAQAYLLLDPSVDQFGVPTGEEKHIGEHEHESESGTKPAAPSANGKGKPQSLESGGEGHGQSFRREITRKGHVEPPRVQPNPAEKAIQEMHEEQEQELRGARADIPRPQPRVGGSV